MTNKWWTTFGDQQLNDLVDTALNNNFDLKSAWFQLRAAQAVVDRESSALLPDIEGSVSSAINRPQPDFVGGENVQLGLSASYEVDLWGRISSQVDAERYRALATESDYRAAAISISAQITSTWYQLQTARLQLEVISSQVETNSNILSLIRSRFNYGQVGSVDILRQQQLLEATREQLIIAESNVQTLEHQLSVLIGKAPQQRINYQTDTLPEIPQLPETGLPLELVRRRPDVQSAAHQLRAADRDLASAISSKYPRLSIGTSVQLRANSIDNLFENWAYSLAANLVAPIFYGGRLRAEVDRAEAVKSQLLYQYGQTVLNAFREVEDALILEQQQKERISNLRQQLDFAKKSNQQLRTGYYNGVNNYIDVLTGLDAQQRLERDLIAAQYTLVDFRISLYRALAGGFETPLEAEANQDG